MYTVRCILEHNAGYKTTVNSVYLRPADLLTSHKFEVYQKVAHICKSTCILCLWLPQQRDPCFVAVDATAVVSVLAG